MSVTADRLKASLRVASSFTLDGFTGLFLWLAGYAVVHGRIVPGVVTAFAIALVLGFAAIGLNQRDSVFRHLLAVAFTAGFVQLLSNTLWQP